LSYKNGNLNGGSLLMLDAKDEKRSLKIFSALLTASMYSVKENFSAKLVKITHDILCDIKLWVIKNEYNPDDLSVYPSKTLPRAQFSTERYFSVKPKLNSTVLINEIHTQIIKQTRNNLNQKSLTCYLQFFICFLHCFKADPLFLMATLHHFYTLYYNNAELDE